MLLLHEEQTATRALFAFAFSLGIFSVTEKEPRRVRAQHFTAFFGSQRRDRLTYKPGCFEGRINVWEVGSPEHAVFAHQIDDRPNRAFLALAHHPHISPDII